MGLGKTVQSIAFLCHIAETYRELFKIYYINLYSNKLTHVSICISKYNTIYYHFDKGVWGPFLIVSPSSTLHNWQQEIARFVPSFKVVPYWGNPQVFLLI